MKLSEAILRAIAETPGLVLDTVQTKWLTQSLILRLKPFVRQQSPVKVIKAVPMAPVPNLPAISIGKKGKVA